MVSFWGVRPAEATSSGPLVIGQYAVGESLTVDVGTWDSGTAPSIQWTRDGEPVLGANSSSYQLVNDDYLKLIGVRLVGSIGGVSTVRLINGFSRVSAGSYSPTYGLSTSAQFTVTGDTNCAVQLDKTVQCNGSNAYNLFGSRDLTQSAVPALVEGVSNALSIAVDGGSACALLDDGTVKCWGDNRSGQVGSLYGISNYMSPTTVPGISNAVAVGLGNLFSCALLDDGTVKCWGTSWGRLSTSPVAIAGISNAVALSVNKIGCALLSDETVRCFGGSKNDGDLGFVGNQFVTGFESLPVTNLSNVKSVHPGGNFSCAILDDTSVKCWGRKSVAPSFMSNTPLDLTQGAVPVPALLGAQRLAISNNVAMCAFYSAGETKCGGTGWFPDGAYRTLDSLTEFASLHGSQYVGMSFYHGCVSFPNGSVKCWGNNNWGQTGLGNSYSIYPNQLAGYGIQYTGQTIEPTISGEYQVGNHLIVNPGDWGVDATYKYSLSGGEFLDSNDTELTSDYAGYTPTFTVLIHLPGYAYIKKSVTGSLITGGVIQAVGTPSISGEALPAQTLTATNIGNSWDSSATLAYRWFRGAVVIPGATGATYQVQNEDLGQRIKVEVTASRLGFSDVSVVSEPSALIGRVNPAVPSPVLSGNSTVGSTLTLKFAKLSGFSYGIQWYSGAEVIVGATTTTYKVSNAVAGTQVKATITVTKPEYLTVIATTNPKAITGGSISRSASPAISGTLLLGATLTANTPNWDNRTTFSAYKWTRDGSTKVIGTGSTYVLTTADVGHKMQVSVTGSISGFKNSTKISAWSSKVLPGSQTLTPEPTITGSTTIGSALTATPGVWQAGVKFTYQWFQDGKAIKAAIKSTYKLPKTSKGHVITVKVTGRATGYLPVTVTSIGAAVS